MPTRIIAAGYGGPEVMQNETFASIALRDGEVRVAVKAIGVNPYDVKSYSGMFQSDPSKLPIQLGGEASGVVTEINGSTMAADGPLSVGDDVIYFPASGGTYATEIVASGDQLTHKPKELAFEQAAALMMTGATAVHTLQATDVTAGDTVLIHGASGGVGLAGVQLALARNATVIATASERQHEFLRSLGAVPVAYGDGLLDRVRSLAPAVDVALDYIGSDEALQVSLELVENRLRIATIANFGAADAGIQILGGMSSAEAKIRAEARFELLDAVRAGTLNVFIERAYSFDEVTEAHRHIASGHAHGKIILTA